jgi:serine/threonine-protein kinase
MQRSEHIDQAAIDRFLREAEIAYTFEPHPHLVETYAYGEMDDGMPFMIMEFADGERLSEYITVRGKISSKECLYYILDLVSALECVWKAGYIYRDMKPKNVIVKKNSLAAIVDFGLCAKREEAAPGKRVNAGAWKRPFYTARKMFQDGRGLSQ